MDDPLYTYALGGQTRRGEVLLELSALLIAGTADTQGMLEPHMFADPTDTV